MSDNCCTPKIINVGGGSFDPSALTPAQIAQLQALLNLPENHITNIVPDLQPTGNPNEYTVTMTWLDEDGNPQSSGDTTPIIISAQNTTKIDCFEDASVGSEGNDSQAEGSGQFAVGLANELPDQSPTNVVLIRYLDGVGGNVVHTQVGGGPYPDLVSSQPSPPFGPIVVQSTFASQEPAFEAAEMVFATATTTWAVAEFQQYTYAPGSFTLNGAAPSFGGGADLIINAPGGSVGTGPYSVITLEDGTQKAFDATNTPVAIDPAWLPCPDSGFVLGDAVGDSTTAQGVVFNGTGAKVATFNGDIDVTGTIDPDGILFTDNGSYSNVGTAALYFIQKGYDFANIIWINPEDGHAYRANVDLEAGGRDSIFFDNNAATLNMDNLVAAFPIDDDGVFHLHAEADVVVSNGGAAYLTIIDGVRTSNVTADTTVPLGTSYIVSRDNTGQMVLSFTTSGGTGNTYSIDTVNADYDLFNFPPAGPQNAPAAPASGDVHRERYSNGHGHFTYNGTSWDLTTFTSNDDRKFTHRDESGQDYVEGSLNGPQNPPANPDQADVHMEKYDNALVFFNYQASGPGVGWDGNNITYVGLGQPDQWETVEHFNSDFDPSVDYTGDKEYISVINTLVTDFDVINLAGDNVTVKPNERVNITYFDGSWYASAVSAGAASGLDEWEANKVYNDGDEFTFTTTNTTAVDSNGDPIDSDKIQIGTYVGGATSGGSLTNPEMALITLVSPSPANISPTSQHDFGEALALDISPISGTQVHYEGGGGFNMNAADYGDNYYASILNVSNIGSILTFNGFTNVFLTDENGRNPANSPFVIPVGSHYQVEVAINAGGDKTLNLISDVQKGATWTQEDFTANQSTDGLTDKVWRSNSATDIDLTLLSNLYEPGARVIVAAAQFNTGNLTVLNTGATTTTFIDGPNVVSQLDLIPGDVYTLVRQTQGAWLITTKHPSSASGSAVYAKIRRFSTGLFTDLYTATSSNSQSTLSFSTGRLEFTNSDADSAGISVGTNSFAVDEDGTYRITCISSLTNPDQSYLKMDLFNTTTSTQLDFGHNEANTTGVTNGNPVSINTIEALTTSDVLEFRVDGGGAADIGIKGFTITVEKLD